MPHLIVHEPSRRGTVEIGDVEGKPALIVHGDRRHLPPPPPPPPLADFLKREAKAEIATLVAKHTGSVGRKAKAIRYKGHHQPAGAPAPSDGHRFFPLSPGAS